MYIEKIDSPADVKILSVEQMEILVGEIRQALLHKLSEHGGHIGPNLGMVEATIALHYVFSSPHDKIVYDVSHQSYTHKILTGRKGAFLNAADYDKVSGYTNPQESEHDFFTIGHTSTSVSLACGLVKARDLKGGNENIIAVIGDGSLSGGEAYEGLSNAGENGTNMIIVVNDNEMSIAEEHAVALASGIAAGGGKPVYGVYSSFIQRSYDQLSQDLCINNNPATIVVFMGTIAGMNDETHLGFFDIPLICNIPNMVYLAPTCKEEYFAMLKWSIHQHEHPVAIRVPGASVVSGNLDFDTDYSDLNRYKLVQKGEKVAILGLGAFYGLGESVAKLLKEECGVEATLINPRYITGLDVEVLEELKRSHSLVVTLEDGELDGGFGEKIARFYGSSDVKVLNYGVRKEFADRYITEELLKANRLTDVQIVEDIRKYW